ncbi:glutathionylspermidine synthase family protein [Salipiger sp. IMCC34102]|uniref:glutathionylspermidine synthase family protein n=1 Tax=Salipiger sp. IMCC34102 TaxID=2510647 RepID=UPI00101D81FB|nr:glutathionylspermidine synthase family protein [Salipiger sp. IMCC34102]RYH00933.1 glutathionylspermidine synthase family protein [Salipiger sp. IMCC34102]
MKRIHIGARHDWQQKAETAGFKFHTMYGEPYWDEETVYEFSLEQVENDIEDPSTELHAMCREAAAHVIASEELMERLAIPRAHWDLVARSWSDDEPELYGRFDLVYDGTGPAKMIEYNADTPTSLFESASFQWSWLEDMLDRGRLPADTDQFNGTFEALTARFAEIFPPSTDIHFTAFESLLEDYSTVEMLAYAARAADMGAHFVDVAQIGLTETGQFADADSRVIGALFKLYPWEDMLRDDFADHLAGARCQFLEPAWKAVVSNKGILPVLWQLFEGHPNLLPAFFADDLEAATPALSRAQEALHRGTVFKPLFSREGSSITIQEGGRTTEEAKDRAYADHPMIAQAYAPMPVFDGFRPVIGSWIVGRSCVGMGLREDRARITQDLSRFKPHYIRA